jgi:SOS response regulatory protein OraA/RecX
MTKPKTKKKAVKVVEKAVRKAVHKGVTEDAVEQAVEHSIDKAARHKKVATKKDSDTGKLLKKKLPLNKATADRIVDSD